jgi:hypothetical protein
VSSRGDEEWERRYDAASRSPWKTALKVGIGCILVFFALMTVAGVAGWGFGFFQKTAEVTGADNTEEQFNALIQGYEDLKVAAENACQAKGSEQSEAGATLLEDPDLAYDALYRQAAAEYNARFDNWFQAGGLIIDLPAQYPRDAPTLPEMQQQLGLQGC